MPVIACGILSKSEAKATDASPAAGSTIHSLGARAVSPSDSESGDGLLRLPTITPLGCVRTSSHRGSDPRRWSAVTHCGSGAALPPKAIAGLASAIAGSITSERCFLQ
jgi:hypothetical protein